MPMPRLIPTAALLAVAILLVLLVGGCQATPGYLSYEPGHGLLHRPVGQPRSLVMDSVAQQAAAGAADPATFDPWYVGRNDVMPGVVYGERVLISETSYSFTRDQQFSGRGRVVDRYQQSTLRERITETRR